MKWHHFVLTIITLFMINELSSLAITITTSSADNENDVLNLNSIQGENTVSGGGSGASSTTVTERAERKELSDDSINTKKDASLTETQEKRSFFKPDSDRRGGFYPSAPHPPHAGVNVGTNYHVSGNGFSYGAPSGGSEYPSYGGGPFTSHSGPGPDSSPGSHYPPTGHSGGGSYGGSTYGLIPSGGHPGDGHGGHPGGGHGGHPGGGHGGHGGHGQGQNKHALVAKSIILPIAGIALLGAAAVLAKSNPVLLQLGVVGKRRRRDLGRQLEKKNFYPVNPYVKAQ